MKQKNAEILLGAVIVARSTSLLLAKIGLNNLDPFNLLAVRFLMAFFFLVVIFHKKLVKIRPKTLFRGMLLGGAFFAVMTAELFGLKHTDSSTTSFLENTAIVIVPLLEAVLHRSLPTVKSLVSSVVTLGGVALLTLGKGALALTFGELLCLLAALLYASAIILTDRLSRKDEALMLGVLQVGFIGFFALIASFVFEAPRLPSTGSEWAVIISLAVVCSCFGFTLQPVAQRYTTSQRAGMLCALNPLTASILGVVFLHENLGLLGFCGALLILAGITLQNLPLGRRVAISHS